MKNNVALKFAASSLILGVTMVGCKPSGYRPMTASAKPAKADEGAAQALERAQTAVRDGNVSEAVEFAERAVELSPRDVHYRMMLADLYMKSGRFVSAEQAFGDVLSLDENNGRAALSRTLALIGQGKTGEATLELERLSQTASPADVGLAFALAGQPQRGVEMLEPAARAQDANGRVRQNLALAYALAGEWQKAKTVAAQDLSPAELDSRLESWAALARPSAPHSQVAALLGVNPVEDGGQPTRLALAPAAPEAPLYAEAQAPQPAPLAEAAPVQVAAAPEAPAPVAEVPAPVLVAEAPIEVRTPANKLETIERTQLAAAVQSLVEASAPVIRASAPVAKAPLPAFKKAERKPAARTGGRYVVQLGAFRTAAQVEKAWAQAVRRHSFAGGQPLSTTVSVPGKGTFHRLAVSGFQTPTEAARLCQSIRGKGGACFVRATAGDAPVQWASRYTSRRA